jgi:amidase
VEALAAELGPLAGVVEEAALPQLDFARELESAGSMIGMMVDAFKLETGSRPYTFAQYLNALHARDQSILAWDQFFETWDVLVCPASMVAAFPHCARGSPLRVDGKAESYWMLSAHGTIFNYSGHPALVMPYKLDRDGLPIGIQIVGRRWGDSRLLAIGRALAEVTGPFRRPPGY